MANNDNILVLVFSSDNYNKEELNAMAENERYQLADVAKNFGYDEADILTLPEFQRLFNSGDICADSCYIYFHSL